MKTSAAPMPDAGPLLGALVSMLQGVPASGALPDTLVKTVVANNRIVATAALELLSLDCVPGTVQRTDTGAPR
ncbi:MAG: hypothetical protein AB7P21_21510 [Lautropia sp.]